MFAFIKLPQIFNLNSPTMNNLLKRKKSTRTSNTANKSAKTSKGNHKRQNNVIISGTQSEVNDIELSLTKTLYNTDSEPDKDPSNSISQDGSNGDDSDDEIVDTTVDEKAKREEAVKKIS